MPKHITPAIEGNGTEDSQRQQFNPYTREEGKTIAAITSHSHAKIIIIIIMETIF